MDSELNGNSRDQHSFGTFGKTKSAQASPRVKPQDRINVEKPGLSYADFHREIMKKVKDVAPKSPGNHKQPAGRKGKDEDELVKYMSKLPYYLERGRHPQEKVLNVGVLDWGRLERWQSSQKQMPHVSGRSSISSSDFSSASSMEASSSNSSRRFIFSPDRQRMHRPSLQSHLKSSPIEGSSQVVKSTGEYVRKLPHFGDSQNSTLNKDSTVRTDQSFDKINQKISSFECRRSSLDAKTALESGTLSNGVKYEIQSSSTGKMKTQDAQFMKKTEMPRQGYPNATDQDVNSKTNTVVLLLPRDFPKNHPSVESNSCVSTAVSGAKHSETSRRSISVGTNDAALDSHVPQSCPLLHEEDSSKNLQGRHNCSTRIKSGESPVRSHSVPRAARFGASPSRDCNVEDRKSTVAINKPNVNGPLVGSDQKVSKVAVDKGRSTSPFRRLSFSMGKMGRSSNPKEIPIFSKPSSTYAPGHSSSEYPVSSSGLDASASDRSSSTSRARSSPLRRLLDPILKPKPVNRNTIEPLPRDSISKDETCKQSDRQLYTSNVAGQPGRSRVDVSGCKTININHSFQEKKHGSAAVQALLRVAVKNGQPLFTFAVDNEKNVLAATMKISTTSRKEDYSCLYTFFAIQEVKKKNGMWSKGHRHDYIPNVVAQMKVFGSCNPNLSTENLVGRFSMREFVLFSVNLRQSDQQTSDYQPNDELAAMVIKFPLKNHTRTLLEEYPGHIEKDSLPEVMEKLQNLTSISTQDISATVILPSGVHTVPRKGEPSSLIQRWKSGGSCDCGGWDLGCKLQILANQNQLSKTAGPSKSNKFELFPQVNSILYQSPVLPNIA